MTGWGDERGAATVLVVGLVAVVATLVGTVGLIVQAHVGRSAAQTAADLAALAGATVVAVPAGIVAGPTADDAAACTVAGQVADRNGARVDRCELGRGGVVDVRVSVDLPVGAVTARARAGPAAAR